MRGFNQRVLRAIEIIRIVSLNRLHQKRQPQQENDRYN
jgi:hypothetical protein